LRLWLWLRLRLRLRGAVRQPHDEGGHGDARRAARQQGGELLQVGGVEGVAEHVLGGGRQEAVVLAAGPLLEVGGGAEDLGLQLLHGPGRHQDHALPKLAGRRLLVQVGPVQRRHLRRLRTRRSPGVSRLRQPGADDGDRRGGQVRGAAQQATVLQLLDQRPESPRPDGGAASPGRMWVM
jgi:hypothetical protein